MTDNKNTERTGGFEKEKPGAARPGWTYEKVLEPNRMEYEDGDGLKHAIYMPKGTASKAGQHLVKQEWGELAKFPRWDNHEYTEDDYIHQYIRNETGEIERVG